MNRWIVFLAGVLGALGVGLGAFAAHGLAEYLAKQNLELEAIAKRLDQCDVAIRYHMLHVVALLAIGLSASSAHRSLAVLASAFFLLGMTLFSGGLYSMVFLGVMGHWAIVPAGGLCLILGWCSVACLALGKVRSKE